MFFINNPWTLVISIVIIVFLILMGIKIVNEISLNKLLNERHQFMRVDSNEPQYGFKKRIGFLTSTALAPIAVVAIVLGISSSVTNTHTGEFRAFDDSSDIETLYDEVLGVLPRTKSVEGVEYPVDSSLDYNEGIASDYLNDSSTIGDLYYSVTSAKVSGTVYGGDTLETVVNNDFYYYEALDTSLEITLNNNFGVSKEGSQFIDSVSYAGASGNCTNGYLLQGVHLYDEKLTVVSLEYPNQCLGVQMDDEYIHSHLNVLVSVFDVDDLSIVTNYRLSGNLRSVTFDQDNIYITTKRYLDYETDYFNIEDYLPYYKIDGNRTSMNYEDIIYVEGTTPDSFTSIYGINITNKEVDMETILIDYYNDIYINNASIDITGVVYYLEPFTEIFEYDNPVDSSKTITFAFSLKDGKVEYKSNIIQ